MKPAQDVASQSAEQYDFDDDIDDVDEEQARGLLEKEEDDVDFGLPKAVRLPNWSKRTALFISFGLVLVTVMIVFLLGGTIRDNLEDGQITLQRSNDYALDASWDPNAKPTKREYSWTITDEVANPDGVFRPMILINKQFPGPLIEVNEGDTIVVHVSNQASNATSIHWHGIYQRGSNWMDGPSGVTQCPIAPGSSFTYEFNVDGQSGTYWYHAHFAVQTADGLFGPLIIHSRGEKEMQKIPYATDRIVMVQDYYHDPSPGLLVDYLGPDKENAEPVPDGALINGQNMRDCAALPHRKCDSRNASLPMFDLEAHQNHRIRFINVGAFAEFQVQIDEHQFGVTEVDGTDVLPEFYHRLNILPGQRYSIVISTNHSDSDAFWMRARMVTTCFAEPNPDLEPEARAIIRYHSETSSRSIEDVPKSKDWPEVVELECRDMNVTDLRPVEIQPAPSQPDMSFYIRSNFEIGAHRLSRGYFNNTSFRHQLGSPTLHRLFDGLSTRNRTFITNPFLAQSIPSPPSPTDLISTGASKIGINMVAFNPKNEMVIQTPRNSSIVDLIFTNFDDGAHPLHLHGHKFWVLGQGQGYPPPEILNLDKSQPTDTAAFPTGPKPTTREEDHPYTPNLANPLRRDTASVPAYGWIFIRVRLDNPGAWLLHCHIAWHHEAGMAMVLAVGVDDIADGVQDDAPTDAYKSWPAERAKAGMMCKPTGLEKGARVGDEFWDDEG